MQTNDFFYISIFELFAKRQDFIQLNVSHFPDFMELRTQYDDDYPLQENTSNSENSGIMHTETKIQYASEQNVTSFQLH